MATLQEAVEATAKSLAVVAAKHPDLAAAARAGTDIAVRLARWARPARDGGAADPAEDAAADVYTRVFGELAAPTAELELTEGQTPALLADAATRAPASGARDWTGPAVRWVEHGLHHIRLHSAPLSVAKA